MLVVFTFKIKVSMKLSVNKKKLTGLWARNCVTIQQVVILILPSGPKSFQVFRETGPWALYNQITPDPRVSFFLACTKLASPAGNTPPAVCIEVSEQKTIDMFCESGSETLISTLLKEQ